MEREDIIKLAVEKLKKVKKLPIELDKIDIDIFSKSFFDVNILITDDGTSFMISIDDDYFTAPAGAFAMSENPRMAFDDIVMLRIAKLIFEEYKLVRNDNAVYINSPSQTITGTKANSKTLNVNGDIMLNGSSVVSWSDTVSDKVKDLEKALDEANDKIKRLEALEKILEAKGII